MEGLKENLQEKEAKVKYIVLFCFIVDIDTYLL